MTIRTLLIVSMFIAIGCADTDTESPTSPSALASAKYASDGRWCFIDQVGDIPVPHRLREGRRDERHVAGA